LLREKPIFTTSVSASALADTLPGALPKIHG
jgi:hypothetical protein